MNSLKLDRRKILLTGAAGSLWGGSTFAQSRTMQPEEFAISQEEICDDTGYCSIIETQQGDPLIHSEDVKYEPTKIIRSASPTRRASLIPRVSSFRDIFLDTAETFVGKNRENNIDIIKEFCNVFNLDATWKNSSGEEKNTAFCAAAISFAAATAYAISTGEDLSKDKLKKLRILLPEISEYHFFPTVSCIDMFYVALGTRRWVKTKKVAAGTTPKSGWVVIFDWKQTGSFEVANHCGIVTGYEMDSQELSTIEFNTSLEGISGSQSNGGEITRRTRKLDLVKGFINTDFVSPFR